MKAQEPTPPAKRDVGEGEAPPVVDVRASGGSAERPRRRQRRPVGRYSARIRGLRLTTKLMLLGLPLALVLVPWASFALLERVEQGHVQMQSNHLQVIAGYIAEDIADLLDEHGDLLRDLPADPDEADLVAHRIAKRVWLNARPSEWSEEALLSRRFGSPESDGSFTLSLGTRPDLLFAYLEITDDMRVYRNPDVLRLDNADQVRIGFSKPDGEEGRITVTLAESGDTTAYTMDPDWRFADTGPPVSDVRGFVRETDTGYALEMRMGLELLGSREFTLAFVDVDVPATRDIRAITSTAPSASRSSQLFMVRSPELLKILNRRSYQSMRIRIIDIQREVRADRGALRVDDVADTASGGLARVLVWLDVIRDSVAEARDWTWRRVAGEPWGSPDPQAQALSVEDEVIARTLAGESVALRRRVGTNDTILAGHPILEANAAIGMVAVEQNMDDILVFKRQAFDEIAIVLVFSFVVVLASLGLYAGRLTWRIRGLRQEATAAIDEYGRLRATALTAGMSTGDEIGDLARSVSNMLVRLDQHNTFLQTMPRTLRHEINNPLNTVMTSLDQLAGEVREVAESKYLTSARRGILRIGAIVQNLADAANLEQSLASEELDVIDIRALLDSYVTNCRTVHRDHSFVFRAPPGPILAKVADYRIEQMLDKLIDNAIDFHRANSPVKIQLDRYRDTLQITVANRGPMLSPDVSSSVFESMVSRRASANELHFGLGLYVVRVIAEQHGGSVRAMNLLDGSGVAVMVRLPLAEDAPESGQPTEQAALAG